MDLGYREDQHGLGDVAYEDYAKQEPHVTSEPTIQDLD